MPTITEHRFRSDPSNHNHNKNSSESLGFRNDNSSAQYQASKQDEAKKLAAIDAAKQADAQRLQDKSHELDVLRAKYENSQERLSNFNEKFIASQNENKELKRLNTQLSIDLKDSQDAVKDLQREVDWYKLDEKNDLPMNFHEEGFMLVGCVNRLAIDFAADNGTRCHGWPADPRNPSQDATLRKVDKEDPKSPWTISCMGRYLEFTCEGDYARLSLRNKANKNQEWYIGSSRAGAYTLWNVAQKCYLSLHEPTAKPGCDFVAEPERDGLRQLFIPISTMPF